jgi:DNA-binding NtrC family response regulator
MIHPKFTFQQSVLFIDDQTKFENLIRNGLLNFPAQYEFCPSRVSTAMERLQSETPDLIVSTLDYREGNVLELIRGTNGYLEKVPSIYLSEPHLADLEAEVASLGRFTIMERKADPLELVRKMAQVIAENIGKERPARFQVSKAEREETPHELSWAEAVLGKKD